MTQVPNCDNWNVGKDAFGLPWQYVFKKIAENEFISLPDLFETLLNKNLNLSDLTNIALARSNLSVYSKNEVDSFFNGIGDWFLYMPVPYPKTVAPSGTLAMMGQSITQQQYPKLFSMYGPKLPDMRAYSIRGLDNGRGIDAGRVILSEQGDAIRNITGYFPTVGLNNAVASKFTGSFYSADIASGTISTGDNWTTNLAGFDASLTVPVAAENRVKTIAYNYIVRAG